MKFDPTESTKGEWKVVPTNTDVYVDGPEVSVATMAHGRPRVEQESNASLIAAAVNACKHIDPENPRDAATAIMADAPVQDSPSVADYIKSIDDTLRSAGIDEAGRRVIMMHTYSILDAGRLLALSAMLKAYVRKKALAEITKGKGRYSSNQLTHAENTIEDMKAVATAALVETANFHLPAIQFTNSLMPLVKGLADALSDLSSWITDSFPDPIDQPTSGIETADDVLAKARTAIKLDEARADLQGGKS